MKVLVGFVGLLAVFATHGCLQTQSCTEMGCVQGVTMNLSTPLEEPGEYQFEVIADGQTFTCTAVIPMRRDGTDPVCSDGLSVQREEITTTSGSGVSGTAGDRIVALWVQGHFTNVSVTGTLDGVEVFSADVAPQYQGVEINGEGCGECPMATSTIGE